jgi:AAA family ATP:ADP antiporter
MLSAMMCLIVFNYQLLWDAKYTLIVHAAGAEALSLTKIVGVVPGAIIAMLLYTKLSTRLSRKKLFFASVIPFLLFFALFAFVLYPYRSALHPSDTLIEELSQSWPRLKTFFLLFGNWSYVLFFVISELWGSIALSLLFWQLANDIVSVKEAKRFYPLFSLVPNLALIVAGITIRFFSEVRGSLVLEPDPWGVTLSYLIVAVIASGVGVLVIYNWICSNVVTDHVHHPATNHSSLSFKESFLRLIESKHLRYIALIVICYGVSQNIIEGVWQDQVRTLYNDKNAYSAFMGNLAISIGMATTICILIGSATLRYIGWKTTAFITPFVIISSAAIFFLLVIFKNGLSPYTEYLWNTSPLILAVWVGFFQDVITKASKYSFFDPTKEICYIPLDRNAKMQGKAAIDVVGARFGKCGGAFVQQGLLLLTASSLSAIAPYLAVVSCCVIGIWLFSIDKLHTSLKELQDEQEMAESV